jgi:hypothetical protein
MLTPLVVEFGEAKAAGSPAGLEMNGWNISALAGVSTIGTSNERSVFLVRSQERGNEQSKIIPLAEGRGEVPLSVRVGCTAAVALEDVLSSSSSPTSTECINVTVAIRETIFRADCVP